MNYSTTSTPIPYIQKKAGAQVNLVLGEETDPTFEEKAACLIMNARNTMYVSKNALDAAGIVVRLDKGDYGNTTRAFVVRSNTFILAMNDHKLRTAGYSSPFRG